MEEVSPNSNGNGIFYMEKRTLQEGFGLTPSLPSVAQACVRIHRVHDNSRILYQDYASRPVHVNLQKLDTYCIAQALQGMTPGEKALVYSFPSRDEALQYRDHEENEHISDDTCQDGSSEGYVTEVTFAQWCRVGTVHINDHRSVLKEVLNEGSFQPSECVPSYGDGVNIDLTAENIANNETQSIEGRDIVLGEKSYGLEIDCFIQTMTPGERARFLEFSVDAEEVRPTHVWTVFLRDHTPKDLGLLTPDELLDFAESHRQEGNLFFKDRNLFLAQAVYARALEILDMPGCDGNQATKKRRELLTMDLLNNLALLYTLQQKWSMVVDYTNKSLAVNDDAVLNMKGYVRRAEAFIALREFNEGIKDLRLVALKNPNNQYVLDLLATARGRKDDRKQRAKRIYEQLLDESNVNSRKMGRVKTWNTDKRYGFVIDNDDDREYFFHWGEVKVRKLPVRMKPGDEVSFDLSFDKTRRLRAANITALDGSPLQGSDEPINDKEREILNRQIKTEVLKVDFEEAHFQRYISNEGATTVKKGTVTQWHTEQGDGIITDSMGNEHFFTTADLTSEDPYIRQGDAVQYGSIDIDGVKMKRAIEIKVIHAPKRNDAMDKPCLDGLLNTRHSGECVSWNPLRSFGFIRSPTLSKEIFVHRTKIEKSIEEEKSLFIGEKVEFDVHTSTEGKKQAVAVTGPGGKPVLGNKKIERH